MARIGKAKVVVVTMAALTAAMVSWIPAAQADTLVTCPVGYETATYDPGLTTTEQQVTLQADGATGPCVGDANHTAGLLHFDGSGELSCVSGNSTGSGTIDWTNSGTTATEFTFTGGVSLRPAGVSALVLQGEVTDGDFTGHDIEVVILLVPGPTQALQCLTPAGVETSSGTVTILIM